jgi:hypothetical protein
VGFDPTKFNLPSTVVAPCRVAQANLECPAEQVRPQHEITD